MVIHKQQIDGVDPAGQQSLRQTAPGDLPAGSPAHWVGEDRACRDQREQICGHRLIRYCAVNFSLILQVVGRKVRQAPRGEVRWQGPGPGVRGRSA